MSVRMMLAAVLLVTVASCSSEPDEVSRLIAKRYSDCMPGLKASDVKRVSDRRYSVSNDRYAVAWTIGGRNAKTGEPFTSPAEDSVAAFERLGC